MGQSGAERAAALTPNTAANNSDEISLDLARARSLVGGTAISLVFNWLDVAFEMEELIERIVHVAIAENLDDAGMSSANSEASSEEPELVWAVLRQAMKQTLVRKADKNRTDRDGEH